MNEQCLQNQTSVSGEGKTILLVGEYFGDDAGELNEGRFISDTLKEIYGIDVIILETVDKLHQVLDNVDPQVIGAVYYGPFEDTAELDGVGYPEALYARGLEMSQVIKGLFRETTSSSELTIIDKRKAVAQSIPSLYLYYVDFFKNESIPLRTEKLFPEYTSKDETRRIVYRIIVFINQVLRVKRLNS